jgi:Carbohydrate family 9 binding domain-like
MTESTINAVYVHESLSPSDFENQAWQKTEPVRITRLWSGEPAATSRHAEARLCWSDDALHVRFDCIREEPLIVTENPVLDKKTLGLWDRDVCEIFLAPDASNPSRYFEFEAAPTGEWVDLGITLTPTGRETDWDFSSGFTIAAKLEERRLLIGMRIPWSEALPKPQAGDLWRVNLFRCAGPDTPSRYLAWRPTHAPEPAFHVAKAFGLLRFNDES